jgi:hypothetical protein
MGTLNALVELLERKRTEAEDKKDHVTASQLSMAIIELKELIDRVS